MVPRLGRTPGEIVAVIMTCRFSLSAILAPRLATFTSLIALPGLAITAYPRRNAG